MSDSVFKTGVGQDWNWVAHWDHEPSHRWDIWQYGLYKGEDGNRFDGTVAELRALGGADMARYINLNGYDTTSLRRLNLAAGFRWKYLDGSPGGTISNPSTIAILGRLDSASTDLVGIINTGTPYSDKVARPTAVLIETGSDTYAIPKPVDTTPFDQAAIDAAVTAATKEAQVSIDTLTNELLAAQAEADRLQAELETAIENEKARIRGVLGV